MSFFSGISKALGIGAKGDQAVAEGGRGLFGMFDQRLRDRLGQGIDAFGSARSAMDGEYGPMIEALMQKRRNRQLGQEQERPGLFGPRGFGKGIY